MTFASCLTIKNKSYEKHNENFRSPVLLDFIHDANLCFVGYVFAGCTRSAFRTAFGLGYFSRSFDGSHFFLHHLLWHSIRHEKQIESGNSGSHPVYFTCCFRISGYTIWNSSGTQFGAATPASHFYRLSFLSHICVPMSIKINRNNK